ncbi:MAG: peptidyl-dipeptidase Dcp, partial [Candidatus Azotimanducaceae bacterium]
MENPLLATWHTPYQLPPFAEIEADHYLPAFKAGFAEQVQAIEAIVNNPEAATFANTIEAIETSGETLTRISPVFFAILSSNSDDQLRAIQSEVVPLNSAHLSRIFGRRDLFERVQQVMTGELSDLKGEQQQLLREIHNRMVRMGADLDAGHATRIQAIDTEL